MSVPLAVGVAYGRKKQQNNSTRRSNRRDLTATSRTQGDSRFSADEDSIFCNSSWPLRKLIVCSVVCCAGLNAVKQVSMFSSRLPSPPSTPASPPPLYQDSALRGSRHEDSQRVFQTEPYLQVIGDQAWTPSVGSLARELEATDSSRLSGISVESNSPPLPMLPPLSSPTQLDNQPPLLPPLQPLAEHVASSPASASAVQRHAPPSVETGPTTTAVAAPSKKKETLVSAGKPARSDVRGNLGPASVITSEVVKDWLKDRSVKLGRPVWFSTSPWIRFVFRYVDSFSLSTSQLLSVFYFYLQVAGCQKHERRADPRPSLARGIRILVF